MGRVDTSLVFDLTYYPVVILSFCVIMYLYKKCSPGYLRSYQKLTLPFLLWIRMNGILGKIVSSLHATVVSVICIYTLLYDEEVYNDPIWCDRPLIRINCAILTGYVMADSVAMMLDSHQNLESLMYYLHHGSAAYAYYFVFSYGVLSYFANYRIMAEFSTVFVNLRWILDKVNYDKTSTLFIVNGCVMTFTFISARVFSMPKYWYTVYRYIGSEDFALLGKIADVMIGSCLVLDILNIKWSIRMLKGAHKVVLAKLDKNKNEVSDKQKSGKQS